MGRPPISDEPRVTTAVRFPTSVHRRLRRVATERDVSVNLLINRSVNEFLERLPSTEEALGHRRSTAATEADG